MALAVVEYAQEHPVQAGAIAVVAGLALYLVLSSGSSSTQVQSGGPAGPTDAELAASIQQAQIQGQIMMSANQYNAQLRAIEAQGANELAIAKLEAQTATQLSANEYEYRYAADEFGYLTARQDIAAQRDIALSGTAAQYAIAQQTISTQEAIELSRIQSGVEQQRIINQTAITQATLAAQTTQQLAQTQAQMSANLAATQVAISHQASQVAVAGMIRDAKIADIQASSQTTGALIGLGGSVVRGLSGGFF